MPDPDAWSDHIRRAEVALAAAASAPDAAGRKRHLDQAAIHAFRAEQARFDGGAGAPHPHRR